MIDKPSPNFDDRKDKKPSLIILHYTGMETAEEALDRLTDSESKVSSHYTVDEDGAVYSHVDEAMRAWHAGQAFWRDEHDINSISIGIEIVNPGHEYGYRDFPDAQINQVKNLCLKIMERYDIDAVLAHSDIAPDRKEDPGELFPWKKLAEQGVGVWPNVSEEDMVKGLGIDPIRALNDLGYAAQKPENMIIAFQRHFVPEVFQEGTQGEVCHLTKGRLYALLARDLISD